MTGASTFETACGLSLDVSPGAAGPTDICLRPESIDLLAPGLPPSRNQFAARVVDVTLLGASRQLVVELPNSRRVMASQPNRAWSGFEVGQSVTLAFPAEACLPIPVSG